MTYDEAVRGYESVVRRALLRVGGCHFRVEIHDDTTWHTIGHRALSRVILPELKRAARIRHR